MQEQHSYELANVGDRLVAIIVDTIILGALSGIVIRIGGHWLLGGGLGFFVGLLYNGYFWTQHNGQTPGKALMGLRVIKVDGSQISAFDAFIRYVGYYINSAFMGLGWIWSIFDSRSQGWHDKLAGTYVVRAQSMEKVTIIKPKRKNEEIA